METNGHGASGEGEAKGVVDMDNGLGRLVLIRTRLPFPAHVTFTAKLVATV
jgi:hypothetical protein